MAPKYTTVHDELNNETFYYRDGVEFDPADEIQEENGGQEEDE